MLPPAVDPALERAMMGEVPAPAPEKAPGIPGWAEFVPPRWWPLAAGSLAIALVTSAALLFARRPASSPSASKTQATASVSPAIPAPRIAESSPTGGATPDRGVVSGAVAEAMQREPAQDPTTLGQREPPPAPAAPAPRKAVPSIYAKQFGSAQKALWTGRPAGAESILKALLRKSLPRRDRARASKMMGDAEAKKGHKAAAAGWYRKSLALSDDPDERVRIAKLLR